MHAKRTFRVPIRFYRERPSSLTAWYFEYADVFKEIIIREELCGTIHRPLKGDGKLHVSAPHRAALYFVALCPRIN